DRAGPDLLAHLGVSREGKALGRLGMADDADGLKRVSPAALLVPMQLRLVDSAAEVAVFECAQRRAAGDQVRIDEKMCDAGLSDEQLDARAITWVVVEHGGHPVVPARGVRALGQPHPARLDA